MCTLPGMPRWVGFDPTVPAWRGETPPNGAPPIPIALPQIRANLRPMRLAIHILAAIQLAVFGWAVYDTSTSHMDAAGRGMAQGMLVVGGGVLVVLLGLALILARSARWAWLGLVFALVFPALWLVFTF